MKNGKYSRRDHGRKRVSRRLGVLLIALALILSLSVSGVLAYLLDDTTPVNNTFDPASVPNSVVEDVENGVKNDVKIKNDGNIDAYIRAAVVVTWADDSLNTITYHAQSPQLGTDYEMEMPLDMWAKGEDGFYYYLEPVSPEETTDVLLTACKALKAGPDGCKLSVEIMGQSIQAKGLNEGEPVVEAFWPVTVNDDGSLTIAKEGQK